MEQAGLVRSVTWLSFRRDDLGQTLDEVSRFFRVSLFVSNYDEEKHAEEKQLPSQYTAKTRRRILKRGSKKRSEFDFIREGSVDLPMMIIKRLA